MQERGEPLLLVALQNGHTNSRGDDEDKCDRGDESRADDGEVGPGNTTEVHHGEGGDREHHRGAEVRLQENEGRRGQSQAEISDRALPRRAPPGAVDDEPGERQHEQELAELGRLEAEEGEFERARRAAGGEAEDEDQGDAGTEEGVDPDPQLAEARIVDSGQQQHPDHSEDAVESLPVDVVVGTAGDVVGGRLTEREDAEGDQRHGRQGQRPVHMGEAEALADAGADRERLGVSLPAAGGVHQPWPPSSSEAATSEPSASPFSEALASCPWKYASSISLAAGAALSAPKPPSSILTAVTIFGWGYGASPMYQDWFAWPDRSAVPVLPATSIGKLAKLEYEVPPGLCAASCRPSRIAAR